MQIMLRMVGFGDNAGSGFPDILRVWSNYGWKIPELEEDTVMNQVTLTLEYQNEEKYNKEVPKSAEEVPKKEWNQDLDEQQQTIYDYLIRNGLITTRQAADLLGLKDRRARKVLADMCGLGILMKIGATSNLKYVLKDN